MPGVREIREVYRATPDSIGVARRVVSEFATEIGGDSAAVRAIALTVTEACTNVALHAYRDRSSPGEMVVLATETGPTLTVRVIDHGVGLSPRVDSPGLGLGMPLMSRLSRKLEVETRAGAGTEICMQFSLASRPGR